MGEHDDLPKHLRPLYANHGDRIFWLYPCPFCGSMASLVIPDDGLIYRIVCDSRTTCGAEITGDSVGMVETRWNTRQNGED
jgi:hypothetical protein